MPDGGSSLLLAAALGRARANELILLAERLPAAEAADAGLVTASTGSLEELDAVVDAAARRLASAPRRAFALTKEALRAASLDGIRDALHREGRGQRELRGSPEFAERGQALLTRRPPAPEVADPSMRPSGSSRRQHRRGRRCHVTRRHTLCARPATTG